MHDKHALEKHALAEVYSALIGTGDSTAADFLDATVDELKDGILEDLSLSIWKNCLKRLLFEGLAMHCFNKNTVLSS